jgi:hypothetical protein
MRLLLCGRVVVVLVVAVVEGVFDFVDEAGHIVWILG